MSDLARLMNRVLDIEGRKDSIEVGTPSKIGKVKIYFNAGDPPEDTGALVENAIKALEYAKKKYEELENSS